jgi:hypothetical protein
MFGRFQLPVERQELLRSPNDVLSRVRPSQLQLSFQPKTRHRQFRICETVTHPLEVGSIHTVRCPMPVLVSCHPWQVYTSNAEARSSAKPEMRRLD